MASALFNSKVKAFGPRLMKDLGLQAHHVGGIFGNIGVETGEFKFRQEIAPTVKGSKGGIGWPQWTGMGSVKKPGRRRQFETHAKNFDLTKEASYDEACYTFMVWELQNTEKAALVALKRTRSVDAATDSFRANYERPGVLHAERRRDLGRAAFEILGGKTTVGRSKTPVALLGGAPDVTFDRFTRGVVYQELLDLQPALKAKGYYLNGAVDGKWGRQTRNAILAFQADNGLDKTGLYTDALAAAVLASTPVEQPAERALATAETPAVQSSPIVQASLAVRVKAWWAKAVSVVVAVLAGIWSTLSELLPNAEQFRGYFEFPPIVWIGLITAIAAGVFFTTRSMGKDAKKVPDIVADQYRVGGAA